MAGEIDGPRLEPPSGQVKRLVVFLHGYGADGNDLIDVGRAWQSILPDTAFVSPHAPERMSQAPTGRQWFPLFTRAPNERWEGATKAAPGLERFLETELARRKLPPSALALVGFSQGTMMALHVGLRRAKPLAGIIGFSGMLAAPETLGAEIKSRPPVLLLHGDSDEMIPPQMTERAAHALDQNGVKTTMHIAPGVGHGIDQTGLGLAARFLLEAFKLPMPQQ